MFDGAYHEEADGATPVPLSNVVSGEPLCRKLLIQANPNNTGIWYFGKSTALVNDGTNAILFLMPGQEFAYDAGVITQRTGFGQDYLFQVGWKALFAVSNTVGDKLHISYLT